MGGRDLGPDHHDERTGVGGYDLRVAVPWYWREMTSGVSAGPRATRGVWVQLEEPPDRPNEPESTFRAFMDENVREVFEVPVLDAKGAR